MNECKYCKKLISKKAKTCKPCYRKSLKGNNNPNYRGGLPKCEDCGKIINYNSKRCNNCKSKGIHNPNYIDGRKNKKLYCLDCKSSLSNYKAKRCSRCEMINKLKNGLIKQSPNKKELILLNLLNKLVPNEYEYVGDSKFWLDACNPDFLHTNGQMKIIELFGDYWHNLEKAKIKDKQRFEVYKKYGYKTLVVWENELENIARLTTKLVNFNKEV